MKVDNYCSANAKHTLYLAFKRFFSKCCLDSFSLTLLNNTECCLVISYSCQLKLHVGFLDSHYSGFQPTNFNWADSQFYERTFYPLMIKIFAWTFVYPGI